MNVAQTSEHQVGQIYIPGANWVLLAVIVAAVVSFGSSSRLAAAYSVAVTGTMLVTTIMHRHHEGAGLRSWRAEQQV